MVKKKGSRGAVEEKEGGGMGKTKRQTGAVIPSFDSTKALEAASASKASPACKDCFMNYQQRMRRPTSLFFIMTKYLLLAEHLF